ncbi:type I secretion system permease/ATPase [Aestuariivirga sp.]|uniref:type I secretion system permease/ATPase n=1 Tax=Aestuariivirga sp. TaxID=2650926 RepID=UPI0039E3E5D4
MTNQLWSHRRVILSIGLFSCISNLLMLTGSIFMMQVYDRVLTSGSVPTLIALTLIVAVLYLYYGFLEVVRARLMVRIGRNFEESLRGRVFDAVAMLALRKAPSTGGQPVQDMSTIRQFLSGQGPFAYLDMPWVVIYLGVVFGLHPILGIAGVSAAVLIFVLALLTERATRKPVAAATAATVAASAMNEEARRNTEAMHALGMKAMMRDRWASEQQAALDASTLASDRGGIFGTGSRVFRLMVQSGMLALGAWLALKHEITPGTIIASSIIMSRGLAPIEQAVANWQQFLSFRKAVARLDQVLAAVQPVSDPMPLPPPKGLLEVENLTVVMQGQEKPVLQNLSFTVRPGTGLGVIGPTGAGKSTLSRVLVGVLEPARGSVRLDGATFDQRSEADRFRYVGYLPQDVQLFDGTVAQNISRFAKEPDAAGIVAAAKLANVHSLIMRLPQGYDTMLGEQGARLSAGQRQRLALARALYGDPALIVMDEPNSNLDAEGEAALDAAIRAALQRGAALVIVAHRPSALQAVDDVLVLAEGKQAAYGRREDVLKQVTRPRSVASPDGPSRVSATPVIALPEMKA